jgi:hypothetical protein
MSLRDIDKNTIVLSRTPYKNEMSEISKDRLRDIIAIDVAKFLANGGRIEKIEYGVSTRKNSNKFERLSFQVKN